MRKRAFGTMAAALFVTASLVSDLTAAPRLTAAEGKAGFRVLFNGKNLDGWMEVQGRPGTFHVEDGILVGHKQRGQRGQAYWLSTHRMYGDYELRLEYMLPERGNSGVFIRAPHHGRTSKVGMEIQLLDDGHRQPSKGSTGSIYRIVAPKVAAARPANEWNQLRILCHGSRVQITLNGKVVNDANMNDHALLRHKYRKGYIGLSAHSHVVRFRNLRIREIYATPPSEYQWQAE